ncbi:MAG: hypothetical protein Q8M76_03815 [Spirochaetaceae bacterium]|nr:hypothetical protein [Spirochaetaceae bacterium]
MLKIRSISVACVAAIHIAVFALPALAAPALAAGGGYALVYDGPVAAEGGPAAVAAVARELGLETRYISDLRKLPDMLKGAAFFAIGGTEDDLNPLLGELGPKVVAALKEWISGGGRYWGICGGGYIASKGWEEESGWVKTLGLLDLDSESYIEDPDPMIISVTWLGAERSIYYQYGPAFILREGSGVRVLATYDDGRCAALIADVGAGKVALCGPHPEADETWLEDDPPPADAEDWEPTLDLAVAMLKELLSKTGGR